MLEGGSREEAAAWNGYWNNERYWNGERHAGPSSLELVVSSAGYGNPNRTTSFRSLWRGGSLSWLNRMIDVNRQRSRAIITLLVDRER